MPEFRYPAYRTEQVEGGKSLILFSAPATDIGGWAGVPQRMRQESRENIGFQREKKNDRVRELASFLGDPRNVVQNPLLAAQQDADRVRFEALDPDDKKSPFGHIVIDSGDLGALGMLELLELLADHIRARIDLDQQIAADDDRVAALTELLKEEYSHRLGEHGLDALDNDESEDVEGGNPVEGDSDSDLGTALDPENTNIGEFYGEILARIQVLKRTRTDWKSDDFLGFDRDAILAYLLPVVLVDGQHRLRGAVEAASLMAEDPANLDITLDYIAEGSTALEANSAVFEQRARQLPISLLMDPSPSEHVFQFVVVNQKATPLSAALLGTIVSTSLVSHEVDEIGERLRAAKIKFDDSRAISYLTRNPNSPFCGLVQTGVNGDKSNLLQWTVLQGLVRIFRDLSGGRLYGLTNDHAAIWCTRFLSSSGYVAGGATLREKKELWKASDGPWREVFIRFFTLVRDEFADPDPIAANGWGDTKQSNLFNKVSLTILAADFFRLLHTKGRSLDCVDDVDGAFADWISGQAGKKYFTRPWDFGGQKKDADKVKKQLATLWSEYRENPSRVPPITSFQF
ncbi:hypothetical protein V6W11_29710 [Micromonospora profundi]|uniref:hypothetical protein n=1 Tax=Micromonospora profundi TaxID=1420889 RepID=UPI002FF40EC9